MMAKVKALLKKRKPAVSSTSVSLWANGDHPAAASHVNLRRFEGVLTLVDVASDKAPSGARGHRVVLTREAAEAALPSLLGMAVDYKAGWDGHDARQKCGIISLARIEGSELKVSGYLYGRDFQDVVRKMDAAAEGAMGMSYELADAHVADMRAQVWTLTRATFTGAAILLRAKAAYRSTSFTLPGQKSGAEVDPSLPPSEPGESIALCAMSLPPQATRVGLSFQEIADRLGISHYECERAYQQGMKKLRAKNWEPALAIAARLECRRQEEFRRHNVIRDVASDVSEWSYL